MNDTTAIRSRVKVEQSTTEPSGRCPRCGKFDWQASIDAGQNLGCQRRAATATATMGDAAYQRREADDDERAWALAGAGLTDLVGDYLDLLAREGLPDPLGARLTVAVVLADLLSLAGVAVPYAIEARLHEPAVMHPNAAD
jgi:hypothetical protein